MGGVLVRYGMAMDPSLHPSPNAYWRAQRQSRAMMRRAYKQENPTPTMTKVLMLGGVVAAFAFAAMKMREK